MSATVKAKVLYLDHAATTPVDPRVVAAMNECLDADGSFANAASTTHALGRAAAVRVEQARAEVAALIGAAPGDIVFTSGATESDNLAVLGIARCASAGRHIVTSRTEHKAVLDPCRRLEKDGFSVTWLTPDAEGLIAPEAVRAALRDDTVLVSIMHANNETGAVQDIAAIARVCRERGVTFHTDAAQSVGKLPVDVSVLDVDLLSFTAHKLYGPKGIGALYVSPRARPRLAAQMHGGGHERGLRSGTLATHQIAGFGRACAIARDALASEGPRLAALRDALWAALEPLGGVLRNGHAERCLPGLLNVSFSGVEGESLVSDLQAIAVSTGSACSSALQEPSYVLRALGRSAALAESSLRFSLGRSTTADDIGRAAALVQRAVRRLRAVAGVGGTGAAGGGGNADVPRALTEAVPFDPLSATTRALFEALPRAGRFPAGTPGVVIGEAGGEVHDAWVRFELRVAGDSVSDARFQAWGCPHTLAAAAWVADQLPGRPRTDLVPEAPAAWLRRLEAPVEKLGRLLLVEDALRTAIRAWPLSVAAAES